MSHEEKTVKQHAQKTQHSDQHIQLRSTSFEGVRSMEQIVIEHDKHEILIGRDVRGTEVPQADEESLFDPFVKIDVANGVLTVHVWQCANHADEDMSDGVTTINICQACPDPLTKED